MALIEICAANIQSALAAQAGGASRIELCSGLEGGGITPSAGLIRAAVRLLDIPVCVLIRPREGNFVFSQTEIDLMIDDIHFCRDNGAAGVVVGALTDTNDLDIAALKAMKAAAGAMEFVLHRAFDFVDDVKAALETAIQLGFCRILSSGQNASAWEGRKVLQNLVQIAENRITIMPGSGIHDGNIASIQAATGATEFHFSAKQWVMQPSTSDIPGLPSGYFKSGVQIIQAAVDSITKTKSL
jgi:copper homeostasis protein